MQIRKEASWGLKKIKKMGKCKKVGSKQNNENR